MNTRMNSQRINRIGITIPKLAGPFGAYVPAQRSGQLLFVSGQLPMKDGQLLATGPVPSVCSVEVARAAAVQCVLNALAAVESTGLSINDIAAVTRVGVFVSSDATFYDHPAVANAASELLHQIFGDTAGQHARTSVGVIALPLNASVEIDFVFTIAPDKN
jgi:enamine deaminase RidA (YjgF/YER057c/UK114 family)